MTARSKILIKYLALIMASLLVASSYIACSEDDAPSIQDVNISIRCEKELTARVGDEVDLRATVELSSKLVNDLKFDVEWFCADTNGELTSLETTQGIINKGENRTIIGHELGPVNEEMDGNTYYAVLDVLNRGDNLKDGVMEKTVLRVISDESSDESSEPESSEPESSEPESSEPESGEETSTHTHNWVENFKEEKKHKTVDVIGYACKGCDFKTESLEEMRQHYPSYPGHGGHIEEACNVTKELYRCYGPGADDICGFICATEAEAVAHHAASHPDCEYVLTDNVMYCTDCRQALANEAEKADHLEYDMGFCNIVVGTVYKCTQCSFASPNKEEADQHLETSNPTDPYCILGEVTFNKLYVCNGCDFETYFEDEIKAHDAANAGDNGHGGYNSNVAIGTKQVEDGTQKVSLGTETCMGCNETRKKED